MDDLVLAAVGTLLGIYGSGIAAFVLSWFRNSVAFVLALVLGSIAILSGIWIWRTLIEGNGMPIGLIPIFLGAFSIMNTLRRRNKQMG